MTLRRLEDRLVVGVVLGLVGYRSRHVGHVRLVVIVLAICIRARGRCWCIAATTTEPPPGACRHDVWLLIDHDRLHGLLRWLVQGGEHLWTT